MTKILGLTLFYVGMTGAGGVLLWWLRKLFSERSREYPYASVISILSLMLFLGMEEAGYRTGMEPVFENSVIENKAVSIKNQTEIWHRYGELRKEFQELKKEVKLLARADAEKEIFEDTVDRIFGASNKGQIGDEKLSLDMSAFGDMIDVMQGMKKPVLTHPILFAFPNPDKYFFVAYNKNTKTAYPVYFKYDCWEEIDVPQIGTCPSVKAPIQEVKNRIIFTENKINEDEKNVNYQVVLSPQLNKKMNNLSDEKFSNDKFALFYEVFIKRMTEVLDEKKGG